MTKPVLLFGDDNGFCTIYHLTEQQYLQILDEYEDPTEELKRYEVKIDTKEDGYVPDWATKLADIYGFETKSN
jgi:hypothetical protein